MKPAYMQKKKNQRQARAAKGPSQRQLRAGELLRRALAEIVARGTIQDPDLVDVSFTVTEVRISPDLRHATCFVAPLGGGRYGGADSVKLVEALRRVSGYLRGQLAREISFKFMPELAFQPDLSFDKAEEVERLLHSPQVARDLESRDDDDDFSEEDAF